MKTTRTHTAPPAHPIAIEINSVADIKMQALLSAAHAIEELCRAIGSTCTEVIVTGNTIKGAAGQNAPCLTISTRD